MILITTYYKSENEFRQKEIDKCLLNNCKNNNIQKIYLLNDKIYDLPFYCHNKIIQIIISDNYEKQKLSCLLLFVITDLYY
jgi:hypothetical protein